jgi:hypothetical protein
MGEGDNRRFDEPKERWQDLPRTPFWLDAERGPDAGRAFGRLADLTDQAASAAKRAAEAIRAELESFTGATDDAERQGSEEAQLLQSASARLARFDREASGFARLLRQAPEQESPGGAESPASEPASPGARVLARQMAADGYPREKIEERLTERFGVRDARAVVDQMLRSE